MARIFISHSSADEFETVALKQWLSDNVCDDVFLDIDPERGLAAGERWQEALRKAADYCEAVIIVISPAWAKSKWCITEFLLAKSLHKLIFGVVLKEVPLNELPTELTSEWQLCRLVGSGNCETIYFSHNETLSQIDFFSDGLFRLKLGLEKAGLSRDPTFPWPPENDPKRSPYRGLEPLDAQDAAVFFGRDVEILRGLDGLRHMRDSLEKRLFVILGPSGTGKSSFLRAGLLPRLQRDGRHFHPLPVVRPERDPISGENGLAQSLSRARSALGLTVIPAGQIREQLKAGKFGDLLEEIRQGLAARRVDPDSKELMPSLVLPVDQAEELFNSDASGEAASFLQLLGDQIRSDIANPDTKFPQLIIAITVRSDRYEPLQTAPALAGLQSLVFDDLKPMTADRFREVIVGPARRASVAGGKLEVKPDLVERLIHDSNEGGDTLPLLGLTLARLYRDYGADGDLRLDEYEAMQGLASVIKTEAESVLANDEATRKTQLEALHTAFIPELITINPDTGVPMRRVAQRDQLPPASLPLIDLLAGKRLLLTDQRAGVPVVEVAHEALLRQWDILQGWLQDERESLQTCVAVERAAEAWQANGRSRDWLLQGGRLFSAEALLTKPRYAARLNGCKPFLAASRVEENENHAEEERRKRLRRIFRVVVVLLAMAACALIYSFDAKSRADRNFHDATVLRLSAEGSVMNDGIRARGTLQGLLTLIAAHRMAAANPDNPRLSVSGFGFLQKEYLHTKKLLRLFDESDDKIISIAFSPDGRLLAAANADKSLRMWDTATGTPIGKPLLGHSESVNGIAFSPDGKQLVSAGADKALRRWDVASGSPIGEALTGHGDEVTAVAFSPDGKFFVSASKDKMLRRWDAATGAAIGAPLQGHTDKVWAVAISPDSRRIASAGEDLLLRQWDATTGTAIGQPIAGHSKGVNSIAFSPDGKRLLSGSDDKTLRLWDATTGAAIGKPIEGHDDVVWSVAFSPDGLRLASSSDDRTVRFWDASTGAPVGDPLQGHNRGIGSIAFSADGKQLASASADKTLRLWDAGNGVSKETPKHEKVVWSVAFSPDGKRFVSASEDETLRLWDAATGKPIGEALAGHDGGVTSVAFNPKRPEFVSAGKDKTLRRWDATTGAQIGKAMTGHAEIVTSVAVSPDGQRIVSASKDKTLLLWDAATGAPIGQPLQGHTDVVWSVAFSPDGKRIASAGKDFTVRQWDAADGRAIGDPMKGHTDAINSIAYSPDNQRLVSASDDTTLRLWDAKTGKPIGQPLQGHSREVNGVAFSPDGQHLVSASQDLTLRLWDAEIGAPIGIPLQGHTDWVTSVAFSPDGERIVSGSSDNSLRLWPILRPWAENLCSKLTRNMSRLEWQQWVSTDFDYTCQCPGLPVPPNDPKAGAASETCLTPYAPEPVPLRSTPRT